MHSGLVKFEEILEDVKDDTGISNIRNLRPRVRRLIYRCQKDIGFGEAVVLKKIKYYKEDGTISANNSIKLPDDFIKIESYGTCQEGICPDSYNKQGNFLFFCHNVDEFTLIYYALLCDGEGWPMVSENHREAVVSGIAHWLYKPKVFNGEGSMNVFKEMERYYEDRIGEARGMDVWPNTEAEWSQIANLMKSSLSQTLIYNSEEKCYCCVEESINPLLVEISQFFWWQYNDFVSDISLAMGIDEAFLASQNRIDLTTFLSGNEFEYENIGRIAFALKGISENDYLIEDTMGQNITDIVFDRYYNEDLETEIFISKEFYSVGTIYFKLKRNN